MNKCDMWFTLRRGSTTGIVLATLLLTVLIYPSIGHSAEPAGTTKADPSAVPAGARIVKVVIDDQPAQFDVPPFIEGDRTLVPVRKLMEAIGCNVEWDPVSREVRIVREGLIIELIIDSRRALVNGRETELDVPARIVGNRTVVPLRFVSENSGAEVGWNQSSQTATVITPKRLAALRAAETPKAGSSPAPAPIVPPVQQPPSAPIDAVLTLLAPNSIKVGEQFDLNVQISNAADIYAAQVFVEFDPARLEAVSIRGAGFVSGFTAKQEFDNTKGAAWYAVTKLGQVAGSNGTGGIATIRLKAKSAGSAAVRISSAKTELLNSKVQNVQFTTGNAQMTIVP